MGSLVFDKCYPSSESAADAFFSAKEPAFTAGSTSYQSWFEKSGSTWTLKRQSVSDTGVVTNLASTIATVPAFPACDEMQPFNDGMALGWIVFGLFAAVWGIQFLRRIIR